jgi:hypothetical protein
MKLYKLNLTKAQLDAMPPHERGVLLLFGHIGNELNILRKAAMFSGNVLSDDEVMKLAEIGQWTFFMRLLGAKTHEAWEAFRRLFQKNKDMAARYAKPLNDKYGKEWDQLKKVFGSGKSIVEGLRNEHVFHYPTAEIIEASFHSLSPEEDWSWYLSDIKANSFYFASDMVANNAMLRAANGGELQGASDKFAKEVIELSTLVDDLLGNVVELMLDANFPGARAKDPMLERNDLQEADQIRLPFFCAE